MNIIRNSSRPFPHTATGYEDAMRFMELVRLRIGPHVPRDRDFLIDLANAHARECNLLAITYKSFWELSDRLEKETPAGVWEQDITIPETGQVVQFRKLLNNSWEPVTPYLFVAEEE